MIGLPFLKDSLFFKLDFHVFLIYACCKLGDFPRAKKYVNKLLKMDFKKLNIRSYLKCLRDYLSMTEGRYKNDIGKTILIKIYGKKLVNKVMSDFSSTSNIFTNFKELNCPSCNRCDYNDHCNYTAIRNLHMRLKQRMKRKIIKQHHLRRIFMDYT